jgi:hypothetical protein
MARKSVQLLGFCAAFFCLGAFVSCDDNTPECVPLVVTNDCICNTGDRGHRQCTADGLSPGACECGLAGSGAGVSGAAGASVAG